jgi:hypothetical protein
MQHHKYTLSDIENMIPFERDVYITLLSNHVNEENQKAQERAAAMKAARSQRRK